MARKKRKPRVGKRMKSRVATRKAVKRGGKTVRKRQPRSLGSKVKGAHRTVVDTIKGTDQLRNKMELPSTSETE
ncbi:MAG: hypothetical protein WCF47_17660 [Pseudolabrys sp.]